MKTNPLLRILLVLLVAGATASAGCLGALTGDDEPTPASDDGDGNDSDGGDGSGTGDGDDPRVINDAPTAAIRITNDQDPQNESTRGFKGEVLKLIGENSTDEDGFITNWTWTLIEPVGGDAVPAVSVFYGEVVSGVQFGTEGVKVITLTVTDNLGATANASTTYYRDVSYSYGGEYRWSMATEAVSETAEHKFPVIAGAAALVASIQIDGAQAEIALIDPEGTEHVTGVTETDNVTIVMDHGAPAPGNWTIRVTVTYEPATSVCEEGVCTPPVPLATAHEASYGLQGIAWYGEMPERLGGPGDGHDHDH